MLYLLGYLVLVGLVLRFFHVAARGECDTGSKVSYLQQSGRIKREGYTDKTNHFGEDVR